MTNKELYKPLESECIEYQIYALDKMIADHENLQLDFVTSIANLALVNRHKAKRDELLKNFDPLSIDMEKLRVIKSIAGEDKYNNWEKLFNLSLLLEGGN